MMEGIKRGLCALFGAAYASAMWGTVMFHDKEWGPAFGFPLAFGSLCIGASVLWWLLDHWDDDRRVL